MVSALIMVSALSMVSKLSALSMVSKLSTVSKLSMLSTLSTVSIRKNISNCLQYKSSQKSSEIYREVACEYMFHFFVGTKCTEILAVNTSFLQ
jgi:hypothetical protein